MTRKRKVKPWKKRRMDQLLTHALRDLSTGNTEEFIEFLGSIDINVAYPKAISSGVKDLTPDEIQHINDLAIGGRIELDQPYDHQSLAEQQWENCQPGISSG